MENVGFSENPVVRLDGVTKNFGRYAAVDNCTVALYPNHVYGLVGRSGAGKSTLLRLMMGIYLPSKGKCTVFDESPPRLSDAALSRIGYVHQEDELIGCFTGARFLNFIRSHYRSWNETFLRSIVEALEIPVNTSIGHLSPGERQCLAFAAALAHEPELLILDEPASALDPLRRERFFRILLEYIAVAGRTVLISSHLLTDLDRVIDRLLVLHNQHIICDDSLDAAKSLFVRMVVWTNEAAIRSCGIGAEIVALDAGRSSTALIINEAGASALRRKASMAGWHVEEAGVTLEETFQYLVTPGKIVDR